MSAERGNPLLRFLKEARRRRVYTTAAAYIAVALVLIQIGDALFSALNFTNANKIFTLLIFLAFPLVLVLSWMFDVRVGGVERTEWTDPSKPAVPAKSSRPVQNGGVNRAAPAREKPRAPTPALNAEAAPTPERVQRATLAHIRHELKTPINAIIGYSEMLLEDAPAGVFAPDLNRIRLAGRQLLAAVEDILAPDSAQGDLHAYRERIRSDLRDPITAVIGYCEMLAESAGDAMLPDLERIRTSALRLLDLSTDIIQVATGAPLAAHFTEASALTETVLAKLQPLDVAAAEDRQGVLLVVDDNPMNRDLLSRQLARKGYEVATAESGVVALQQLDAHSFDLVLLDIIMPGMDGIEVLRRIRAQSRLDDVSVIMTSSLDEIDSVVRCLENGAADYVTKPFDPTLLDARIGACLKLRHLRQREEYYRLQLAGRDGDADQTGSNALPAAIAARLHGRDAHTIDETDHATILWCDLDRMLHGTAPVVATTHMRAALAVLEQAAAQHNVELVSIRGGSVLLAAGIPTPCDDHAERIAGAALTALPSLRDLTGETRLRFGIHTGAACGTILGAGNVSYHVWGDAINAARTLEARADAGTILLSTGTHAALGDRFEFVGRGVMDLAGRQMRTYTIVERIAVSP